MRAILYVGHGTRVREGERQAIEFIERVKSQMDEPIQEIAFLEISSPSIEEGVATCVAKGATEIIVMPLLLLTAQHATTDLPEILAEVGPKYPTVTFTLGQPIGVTRTMIDAVIEQLSTQPISKNAQLIIVGRGSSEPAIQQEFAEIASRLKLRTAIRSIDIAFLYGSGPKIEDVLALHQERKEPVVLIPYLLFSGLLMKRLERLQQTEKREVILTKRLGEVPSTARAFKEAVEKKMQSIELNGVSI